MAWKAEASQGTRAVGSERLWEEVRRRAGWIEFRGGSGRKDARPRQMLAALFGTLSGGTWVPWWWVRSHIPNKGAPRWGALARGKADGSQPRQTLQIRLRLELVKLKITASGGTEASNPELPEFTPELTAFTLRGFFPLSHCADTALAFEQLCRIGQSLSLGSLF